ncbi:MAG TPA: PKD domain-containing protein [Chitinophagales bacterium]|nr:PKD domain-containing protein [Chitinophagales bacterium]
MRFLTFTLLFTLLGISSYASQEKKTVKIRIQSQFGNLDEATMYFDQGIHPTYDFQEDAEKVLSGVYGVPVIYSVTSDNRHCSINGYGTLSTTEEVALGIMVDVSGNYNLTAPLLDNFDPTSIITLEDRQIGRSIDLRTNFYPLHLDSGAAIEGRFFIHISYPSSFSSTIAGCSNDDAELFINSDTSVTWDKYELFDNNDQPVADFTNVNAPVTFTGLSQGDYYLVRTKGAYQTTQDFYIDGTQIQASIGATALQVETYQNITFSANATNANHFEWDFGDGTLITGVAHPDLAYYEPGVYTVTLFSSNDHGCSTTAQVQVIVTQSTATGINETESKDVIVNAAGRIITIVLPGAVSSGDNVQIHNIIGQPVYNGSLLGDRSTVTFDEHPMGYYLVSVKHNNKISTQRIFIGK